MTTEYTYNDLSAEPCISMMKENIAKSEMTDKNWTDQSYHPTENWLKIWFDADLSSGDKTLLDGIVSGCLGKRLTRMTRELIMSAIYDQAEPVTQLPRLMSALNTQAVFIVALDNYNFDLARLIVQQLVDASLITTDDQTLVDGIIPVSKWVDA